jgi:hypothetical protein
MIYTVDFRFSGKSFVIAFATKDDLRRFKDFVSAYARECTPVDWESAYRLTPDWSVGQYEHVPAYALWAVDPVAISRMVAHLYETRLAGAPPPLNPPNVTVSGTKDEGLRFALDDMPKPRYSLS